MTTDHDTHDPGEPTADVAVDAPLPERLPDDTSATAEPSQLHDEATMRAREGLASCTRRPDEAALVSFQVN